jgi:hypothetical protein
LALAQPNFFSILSQGKEREMAAFALTGSSGGSFVETKLMPGDIILQNESVTVVSSVTGTTLSASNLLTGIISRQGSATAGFTDTFDSATNILYQLSGNNTGSQPVVDPGTSFRVRILNFFFGCRFVARCRNFLHQSCNLV